MPIAANSTGVREAYGLGIGGGGVDGHVWKLNEGLIPLTMNDLLIAVNNVEVHLHHIHALIYAMAHGKDTLEHL
jgi:hypothetical protein